MKNLIALILAGFLAVTASAQYVNFADSGTPVSLTGFLNVDGSPNLVTSPNQSLSADGQVNFSGGILLNPLPDLLTFQFTLNDDTLPGITHQASFSITNPISNGAAVPVTASSFSFGISNLYALDPGLQLAPTFNFLTGNSAITDALSVSYSGGTFTFTNADAFSIGAGQTLTFTGNFATSAVPEPSTYAMIAGLLAVGVAAGRRWRAAR